MTTSTQAPTYRLGPAQVSGPLALFPILGREPVLAYRSYADALALGAFVKELDGGASVNDLAVGNPTDLPVLLYEGEEVHGAQQDRTLDVSALVAAGGQATVPVSCVERGRWDGSRHDEHFAPAPHAAGPELRATKRQRANASFAAGAAARPDQAEVWQHVESRAAAMGAASPTLAQRASFDARGGEIETFAAGLAPLPGQVGAISQVGGLCVALDLVSRPDVYASLAERLVRGYLLDALDQPVAPADDAAAHAFLARVLDAPRARVETPGVGAGLVVTGRGIEGSGLVHEDELIQLSAFPGEGPSHGEQPGGIARPSHRRRRIA